MMKRIVLAVAVLLFGGISMVQAQTQAKNRDAIKAAEKLFAAMKAEELYQQQVKAAIDEQLSKNPQFKSFRPQIESAISKGMPWKKVQKDLCKIYAKKLTADELTKIAEFYQTPTGAKMVDKITDKSFSLDKLQSDPTTISEIFTPEELTEIMTFLQTPAGMKLAMNGQELAKQTEDYLKKESQKVLKSAAKKAAADMLAKGMRR